MLVPLILVLGNLFAPLNFLIIPIAIFFFAGRKQYNLILILVLILFFLGDSREATLQFIKSLRAIAMISVFIVSVFDLLNEKYKLNRVVLHLIPFFFFSLLCLIWSPSPQIGLFKTVSYFLLFFNSFHLIKKTLHWFGAVMLEDIIIWSSIFLSVGLSLIFLAPDVAYFMGSVRFRGLMGNPNGLGNFLTVVLPILFFYFDKMEEAEKPVHLVFKWGALALVFISLILCSSRNALLAVGIFITIRTGLRGGNFRRIIFLFGILPIGIILLFSLPWADILRNLGLHLYFRLGDLESGSGRVYAWEFALSEWGKMPIWGRGFYFEEWLFKFQMPFHLWATGHQGGVHNSYLVLLLNTGLIGLGLFLYFFTRLTMSIKNKKYLIPFLPAMASSAMFESWLATSLTSFIFLFMVSLMLYLPDSDNREFQLE